MNPLDLVLLLGAAVFIVLGWRVGLICGLVSLLAVILGGAGGFLVGQVAMSLLGIEEGTRWLVLLIAMALGVIIAEVATMKPAQLVHEAVTKTRLKTFNNAGGAVVTAGFGLAVVWMMATVLALAPSQQVASLMRGSTLLVGLDRALPADAGPLLNELDALGLGSGSEPPVFTGLGLRPLPQVPDPDPGAITPAARTAAQESVVRIQGRAECGTIMTGSGIVVGGDLVITNAHVIAGIEDPVVLTKGRRIGAPAVPVHFDPALDVALLRVPGLDRRALALGPAPGSGETVVVAGYPNGGPQVLRAAGVRGQVAATGADIYGQTVAQRDVLIVGGAFTPGTSGGALLAQDGRIAGLVFASSLAGAAPSGYALTPAEVGAVLLSANTATRVDTGLCTPGY